MSFSINDELLDRMRDRMRRDMEQVMYMSQDMYNRYMSYTRKIPPFRSGVEYVVRANIIPPWMMRERVFQELLDYTRKLEEENYKLKYMNGFNGELKQAFAPGGCLPPISHPVISCDFSKATNDKINFIGSENLIKLDKQERYSFYCILLEEVENMEDVSSGLCQLIEELTGFDFDEFEDMRQVFPELCEGVKPTIDFWFDTNLKGWIQRLNQVKKAVRLAWS